MRREFTVICGFLILLLIGGIAASIATRMEGEQELCAAKWEDSGMPWRVKKVAMQYHCQIKVNGGWIPDKAYRYEP